MSSTNRFAVHPVRPRHRQRLAYVASSQLIEIGSLKEGDASGLPGDADAVKQARARTVGLEGQMRGVLSTWSLRPTAEAVATITAMTVLAEVGDLTRFSLQSFFQPRAHPKCS